MTLRCPLLLTLFLGMLACSDGDKASADASEDTQVASDGISSDADITKDTATPFPWPTCPQYAAERTPLHEKIRHLDERTRARHLDDGLLRTLREDEDGQVVAYDHVPSTGLWTGMYLASQALRYAVTGEAEAAENAARAARGLHDLSAVTGAPGLYGRAYHRPDFTYTWDVSDSEAWTASPTPGYEGWYYNHDVSKDSLDGIIFGYAVALEHLDDPEVLAAMRADVVAFVERFVDHGLQIVEIDGQVTEHGRLYYSAMDDLPGFNALLALSFIRVGIDAGARPDLVRLYEDCLLRLGDQGDCPPIDTLDWGSYLDAVLEWPGLYLPNCDTSYDHFDMLLQAIYPLLRRETHPELRPRLLEALHNMWQPLDPDMAPPLHASTHSLYIYMYAMLADAQPGDPVLMQAMEDAACTLYRLPDERRDVDVAAGTQETACLNRLDRPNAAEVIPVEERRIDNYLWRLDPYEIPEPHVGVVGQIHSSEDLILAYWLGRYAGYLTPEM